MSFNQFSSSFLFFTVPGPIKGNRGPGANFCFGGLIFPKNVGEWGGGGGEKIFSSSGQIPVTTSVKSFFWINICKILV
jgi:hypothetical protein